MIRRISKNNDLKDLIKSCPSGVIDDIFSIKYYIQGNNVEIEAEFSKVGDLLEVILPSSQLELLPNGILMRRAYYRVVDSSYPDGYYDLEFVDNMNIWLGDYESEEPIIPEYVTEEELSQELASYATQSWVSSQGYLTSVPDTFATKSWVSDQGYITSEELPEDIATKSWVSSNFLSSTALSGYATESWVQSQEFATMTWVESFGEIYVLSSTLQLNVLDIVSDYSYATQSWVESQGYLTSSGLSGYATQSWVETNFLSSVPEGYATESWVSSNFISTTALEGYATQSWVESQGYLTSHQDLTGYATESWVSSNFLSTTALTGYATEQWVNNTLSPYYSADSLDQVLSSYATQSWVSSQGYAFATDLSDYATKSWATSQFFEESKIWVGTFEEWLSLTAAQQSAYTIALIKE